MKRLLHILAAGAGLALIAGCVTLTEVAEMGSALTDAITPERVQSAKKVATAVAKTFDDITPQQEYYIGRSLAATVLSKYAPCEDEQANRYVNVLGQALALASDRPETFGGYHFLILDTDEINAFAAPGGFVLVSKGLLRCCPTEDAVAAVLAHEIGHVQYAHGLRAISASRLTTALTVIGTETAKQLGPAQVAELTTAFEGTIDDVFSTVANSGYSRRLEKQADEAAVTILDRVGYDPNGLKQMLLEMNKLWEPGGLGFLKTHPAPQARIKSISPLLTGVTPPPAPEQRRTRFETALAGIRE